MKTTIKQQPIKLAKTTSTKLVTYVLKGLLTIRSKISTISSEDAVAKDLAAFGRLIFRDFPWTFVYSDWTGQSIRLGQGNPHWWHDAKGDEAVYFHVRNVQAARDILGFAGKASGMELLKDYVTGSIDIHGNMFLLAWVRKHKDFDLDKIEMLLQVARHRIFQTQERSVVNVRSHYDISEEFINAYLGATLSYSCAWWEDPYDLSSEKLLKNGFGPDDGDTLDKAQVRKFTHAANYANPMDGETVLDVGCGYGEQIIIGAKLFPRAKWYGVTASKVQSAEANRRIIAAGLEGIAHIACCEYREAPAVFGIEEFDHILSTGMACHVGPNGQEPYTKWVRGHMRRGGRYMLHVMMRPWTGKPLESFLGAAFNMEYVWPGFDWDTYGEWMRVMEENGFHVMESINLSQHYAATTASWYLRMMANRERSVELVGEQTVRAWEIYLAGASTNFLTKRGIGDSRADFSAPTVTVRRLLCVKL